MTPVEHKWSRARQLWLRIEPIHAVVYFAPEPVTALKEAGFRGFWMGYFAGRAAPLGPVPAEVVHAIFYNFSVERVERAIPAAWTFASPGDALAARSSGSVAALRRALGDLADSSALAEAAALAMRVARAARHEGRPLFAANLALPEPDDPVARLWHAATMIREHRGDGHVAALVASGVGGRESHLLHALASGTPREVYTAARDFDDAEWAACLDTLRRKGLADGDGLSEAGAALKAEIEARTDSAAEQGFHALSEAEWDDLVRLVDPIARAVVRAGDIPVDSPMGLDLRALA